MFNWAVINDVPRGIENTTDSVGAELIMMSPVMRETTLMLKTSGGGVTWSRQVAVRAGIGRTVLSIVTEKMTLKALS